MQSANRARITQGISGLPRVIETGGRNVVVSHTHLFLVGNLKICESTVSGVEVIKFRFGEISSLTIVIPAVSQDQHGDFTRACHASQRGFPGSHVPVPDTFPYEEKKKAGELPHRETPTAIKQRSSYNSP